MAIRLTYENHSINKHKSSKPLFLVYTKFTQVASLLTEAKPSAIIDFPIN
ncbi:hypothetical protein [Streptococcus sp. E24BD]